MERSLLQLIDAAVSLQVQSAFAAKKGLSTVLGAEASSAAAAAHSWGTDSSCWSLGGRRTCVCILRARTVDAAALRVIETANRSVALVEIRTRYVLALHPCCVVSFRGRLAVP